MIISGKVAWRKTCLLFRREKISSVVIHHLMIAIIKQCGTTIACCVLSNATIGGNLSAMARERIYCTTVNKMKWNLYAGCLFCPDSKHEQIYSPLSHKMYSGMVATGFSFIHFRTAVTKKYYDIRAALWAACHSTRFILAFFLIRLNTWQAVLSRYWFVVIVIEVDTLVGKKCSGNILRRPVLLLLVPLRLSQKGARSDGRRKRYLLARSILVFFIFFLLFYLLLSIRNTTPWENRHI